MTAAQDSRAEFEAWYEADAMPAEADWFAREKDEPSEYKNADTASAWRGWQAARRAPATPVPLSEPVAYLWQHCETGRTRVVMPDMVVTADANWIVVGPLYLAAAPQPPEAQASVSNGTFVAPVQLPEPVAFALEWTFNGEERGIRLYDDERHCRFDAESDGGVCHPLYTEQQVRQLLAAHRIGGAA